MGDLPALPSVEAVEYGRGVLTREVERLRKFERQATEKGNAESAKRWSDIAKWIDWQLLGSGHGCVIRAFDARKVDPDWRAWWEGVDA